MKKKHFISLLSLLVVVIVWFFFHDGALAPIGLNVVKPQTQINNNISLITEPEAGIEPVLALINSASSSVSLVMYEFEDRQVDDALVADEKRGVAVQVLVSLGYKGQGFPQNQKEFNFLKENGVPVEWTQSYFALTHQKSLVVDHTAALIMTFNFTPQYYSTSRDFGILDKDQADVQSMEAAFESDWRGDHSTAANGDDLVWSPDSEPALVGLINNAQRSLDIYNEEMADSRVTKALIDAAERGVRVRITMTYSSQWKKAFQQLTTAGALVRTYDPKALLYIHAKMIVVDGAQAFVGSENFSANSLDQNRELGIILKNPNTIGSLESTFNTDWENGTAFAL